MAELKESQNEDHAVNFPLKSLIMNLGSLTLWLCAGAGAATVGLVTVGGGGAGALLYPDEGGVDSFLE